MRAKSGYRSLVIVLLMLVGAGFKPAPTSLLYVDTPMEKGGNDHRAFDTVALRRHIGHLGRTLRREKGGDVVFRIVMGTNGAPDTMVILAASDSRFENNVVAAVRAVSPAVRVRRNSMADTIDGLSLRCEVMSIGGAARRGGGGIAITIKGEERGPMPAFDDDEGTSGSPDEKIPDIIECSFSMDQPPGYDSAAFRRKIIYPEIARRNGIEGMVEVRVLIDKHGKVSEIRDDAGGNPILNEAVRDAIRRTAFTPAIRHISPVDMWIVIPVLFSLSNQTPGAAGGGE